MKRVAITGPESTGKSNLARELALHYNTEFVAEFARQYIDNLDRAYNQEDILLIAQNQLISEEKMTQRANTYLFCDTELIVTKIWSLHKYNFCHPWILEQIEKHVYDLYLLCDVDLPWEYDKQREHPHMREFFFNWYKKELEQYDFPYRIVSGNKEKRLKNAIKITDQFFQK
ncbi:MAG: ATPase [Bacteroidetes bacterium]|nr:MAG: ATPase [Bacteroidota bacterium]